MSHHLFILLFLELLTLPIVVTIFKYSPSLKVGGVIAGLFFTALSWIGLKLTTKTQELKNIKLITTWVLWGFLLLFVLPMLGTRILFWEENFKTINIFGFLPGYILHETSEKYFGLLIISTLIDLIRVFLKSKKDKTQPKKADSFSV